MSVVMTPESLSIGMTTISSPLSSVFVKCFGKELAISAPDSKNSKIAIFLVNSE
jgi:hypothetical protein